MTLPLGEDTALSAIRRMALLKKTPATEKNDKKEEILNLQGISFSSKISTHGMNLTAISTIGPETPFLFFVRLNSVRLIKGCVSLYVER